MQHCILTGLTLFYHCFFCSQGVLMQHCILTDLFLFYLCFFCTVVKWGLPPNGCNPILTLLLLQLRMANAALHPNPEFNQYCIKFASYVLQLKIADAALHPIPGFNPIPPLLLLQLTIAEAELQTNSVFNPNSTLHLAYHTFEDNINPKHNFQTYVICHNHLLEEYGRQRGR